MQFIQNPENYRTLNPNTLDTVELLCGTSGFTRIYTKEMIQNIAATPPVMCSSTEDLAVARIIQGFKWATSPASTTEPVGGETSSGGMTHVGLTFPPSAARTPFLSASLLEEAVRYLDCNTPETLGFLFEERLKLECKKLIANDISINFPIEDWCVLLQNWRLNQYEYQCPMIAVALILFFIKRICLGHSEMTGNDVEWVKVVSVLLHSPNIHEIPAKVDNTLLELQKRLPKLMMPDQKTQESAMATMTPYVIDGAEYYVEITQYYDGFPIRKFIRGENDED